ncbi:hypothetical protein OIE67_46030 [Nonomuraea fuscirosea]|uniref:hypothetical protein n=1 Tax=Nonomuraea fuscirosea TaxID=1291556 RepID=UPI002DDB4349|nr:hypothetical protein [Nonomuraea fuscirosea]WSA51334.1 hypothetical protein OIE67_46030 [Nonomuraea fuscirosea]
MRPLPPGGATIGPAVAVSTRGRGRWNMRGVNALLAGAGSPVWSDGSVHRTDTAC